MNQAIGREKAKRQKERDEDDWWDEECQRKRSEVIKQFKTSKNMKEEKQAYYQIMKEYRILMNRKRIEAGIEIVKEIAEDKTQKAF